MTIRDKAYIVGAYEHPTRKAPDKSVAQLHAESAKGALEDAGLSLSDIDGYFCAGDAPGLGMLNMAGHLPTANTVSIEDLTGSGSGLGEFSEGEARKNTLDRNLERLDGFDVDAVKKKAEENLR